DGLLSKIFAIIIIPPMVASMMILGFMVKIGCRLPVSELAKKVNTFRPTVISGKNIMAMAMSIGSKATSNNIRSMTQTR
ncbi:hypothetical protein EC968_009153, partial [Mortierella alpina]